MSLETRTLKVAVIPNGQPIFCEQCFTVEIDDEAAGEFVVVKQDGEKVAIYPEEWPMLRGAIDQMVGFCRDNHRADGKEVQP